MHILIATDADWIVDEVTAALGDDDVHFTVCRDGLVWLCEANKQVPDLAILDLQVGSMGGMAVTMSLRLDESAGAVDHVRVCRCCSIDVPTSTPRPPLWCRRLADQAPRRPSASSSH